jgi:hypothetical protein
MQQKRLPRYVGVILILLTVLYFLGSAHVVPAASRSLTSAVQVVGTPTTAPATNTTGAHKGSGTAVPDTLSDLILTGACVLLTILLSFSFFLIRRRRGSRQEEPSLPNPETDPIIVGVSIITNELQVHESPQVREPSQVYETPPVHEPSQVHEAPQVYEPPQVREPSQVHEASPVHEPSQVHEAANEEQLVQSPALQNTPSRMIRMKNRLRSI